MELSAMRMGPLRGKDKLARGAFILVEDPARMHSHSFAQIYTRPKLVGETFISW